MGGCFGYRDGGGRKRATKRFGGSPATESAVEAALQWLKRHQESSGYWDAHKWKDTPSHGFIFNRGQKVARPEMDRVNVSMTGMALLAFLGAGYTAKAGKHKETVDRAQNWLMSVLADRVKSLVRIVGVEEDFAISGGITKNIGVDVGAIWGDFHFVEALMRYLTITSGSRK